jgi:hypothetical protein
MNHPIVLTSLEEDLKKLGLLKEDGMGTPAPQFIAGPPGEPKTNKTTNSRHVGALTDDPDGGKDPSEEPEGEPHDGDAGNQKQPRPKLPVRTGSMGPGPAESIRGMPDKLRGKDGGKAKPVAGEQTETETETETEPGAEEEVELLGSTSVMETIAKIRNGAASAVPGKTESKAGKPAPLGDARLDKVASLINDVNRIMESIDDARRSDAVRSFANASIISDMLSRGFGHFAKKYEDSELEEASKAFATMAEDAARVAHALEEGEEVEADVLGEEFRAQMDALMEGLDLYSDVVESDAELSEEEDEEDDDEDEKKKKEKEKEEAREAAEAAAAEEAATQEAQIEIETGKDGIPRHRWASGGIVSAKGSADEAYMPFKGRKPMVNRPAKKEPTIAKKENKKTA